MIIAVINQKGGVGKTTTTISLGAALSEAGHSVVLVDLDAQRDLSIYADSLPAARFLSPSPPELAAQIAGVNSEFVLVDCPPALVQESAAALLLADLALVPLQAHYAAARGLARILEAAQEARGRGNARLQLKILLTMFDARKSHCHEIEAQTRAAFGAQVFQTVVRDYAAFPDATAAHQSILQFAPKSKGALAYRSLAQEILAWSSAESVVAQRQEKTPSSAEPIVAQRQKKTPSSVEPVVAQRQKNEPATSTSKSSESGSSPVVARVEAGASKPPKPGLSPRNDKQANSASSKPRKSGLSLRNDRDKEGAV